MGRELTIVPVITEIFCGMFKAPRSVVEIMAFTLTVLAGVDESFISIKVDPGATPVTIKFSPARPVTATD